MHGKAGCPVKEDILKARDRLLSRYPKLRVVGCHLGSDEDDLRRLAKRLDAFPNFAVDTAARIRYFARGDREQVRQFLTRYEDRILYATDFSLRDTEPAAAARSLRSSTIATGPFSRRRPDGIRRQADAWPGPSGRSFESSSARRAALASRDVGGTLMKAHTELSRAAALRSAAVVLPAD